MGPLTALLLATPIFGLSLTPPKLEALPLNAAPIALVDDELSDDAELGEDGESSGDAEATVGEDDEEPAKGPRVSEPKLSKDEYKSQVRKRAKLAKIHRTLGITTWALTGVAVIAGTIQWRNLYAGGEADNPCVTGNAWLGQGQCSGTPWFHALTGFGAGAAYFSTLSLAIAMPDPDHAAVGDSAYAKNIRTHKILRWVHLSGMVAQMVMGIVLANDNINGGLNRAEDYKTLRALSLAHLSIGYVTFGALSWAGAIML